MSAKRFKLVFILLLVAGVIGGLVSWLGRPKPVEVLVGKVSLGSVQDTVANTRAGTIKACRRAGVSPLVSGQIDALPVKEGDVVRRGALLMALWNADVQAQYKLAQSEALAAESRAAQACVRAEVAVREAERQRQLVQQKLNSEEVADKADGEARAQQAACKAAQASTQVSQSQLDVVRAALSKTRLTAPFDGVVAEVNGEIGEIVTPSPVGIPTPPAIDLMDISCLYVSAPIDEVDAPRIRLEMPANISLDAFSGQVYKGVVRRIAPYVTEVEKQARTVDVEVDFVCPEQCGDMLPGYSADIEVIIEEQREVLRIPTEAVLEGNRVLVFGADDLLEEREIELGLSNWAWSEVVSGLSPGESLVISVEREGVEAGALASIEQAMDP
jgi:HlyD family secretion protein